MRREAERYTERKIFLWCFLVCLKALKPCRSVFDRWIAGVAVCNFVGERNLAELRLKRFRVGVQKH